MSVEAITWAWEQPLAGTEKLVLLALADWADHEGACYPHIVTLARRCGVGERYAREKVAELERDGYLTRLAQYRDDGKQRGNVYQLARNHSSGSGGNYSSAPTRNHSSGQEPSCSEPSGKEPKEGSNDPVHRVLEHYNQRRLEHNPRKRPTVLETPVRTMIRNAVRATSEQEAIEAIDGLFSSPHHLGENDQRKEYLEIRHALKPNTARGETIEERVAKARGWRPEASTLRPRKVEIRLENIRRNIASGGSFEPTRARESERELEEMGWRLEKLDGPPWAEVYRR